MKTRIAVFIALIAALVSTAQAQVPQFPQTLPANTVVGRLGIAPGPAQAIPFANTALTGGILSGVSGDITCAVTGACTIGAGRVTNADLANMTANTVKCNPTGSSAAAQDCTNPVILGITINPTVSTLNQGFLVTQSPAGTTSTAVLANYINITSDTVIETTATGQTSFVRGIGIDHSFGGSSVQGGREAVYANLTLNAATSASNANRNYVGGYFNAVSASGDGGTLPGSPQGALFALNPSVGALTGATGLLEVSGGEVNFKIQTGASAKNLAGWSIKAYADHAVHGTTVDTLLWLSAQGGAIGVNDGILIDWTGGVIPVATTGTLLRTAGGGVAANGINLSNTGFTGAAFQSVNFQVSGTGDTSIRHLIGIAATPTANACAGFALRTGSNDTGGSLTYTSATTCSITFGSAYANAPFCTVSPGTSATTQLVTTTTGGMSVTFGAAQTAFSWTCLGI